MCAERSVAVWLRCILEGSYDHERPWVTLPSGVTFALTRNIWQSTRVREGAGGRTGGRRAQVEPGNAGKLDLRSIVHTAAYNRRPSRSLRSRASPSPAWALEPVNREARTQVATAATAENKIDPHPLLEGR